MCYWIIPVSGTPVADTTVQHVTRNDLDVPEIKTQVDEFNEKLADCLDDTNHKLPDLDNYTIEDIDDIELDPAYGDDFNTPTDEEYDLPANTKDANDFDFDAYDKYVGAQIVLDDATNNGGNIATVKRRASTLDGTPIGTYNKNPPA